MHNPEKSSVNVRLMKILKSTVTKKVIVCYYNLREKNFLKVAAFVIFPTSIMVLFKIHHSFTGHFLNELHVSYKECLTAFNFDLYHSYFTKV